MNTNKPTWNEGDKAGSIKEYAAWLNDNARTMFLEDHAHMEILFLLSEDGNASTIPVPVDQDREIILQDVVKQIKQDGLYAVIHIAQLMTNIPGEGESQVEAVILTAESRDGLKLMYINEIVETEEELKLADEKLFEAPEDSEPGSFFA